VAEVSRRSETPLIFSQRTSLSLKTIVLEIIFENHYTCSKLRNIGSIDGDQTLRLDMLACNGMLFTHCYANLIQRQQLTASH